MTKIRENWVADSQADKHGGSSSEWESSKFLNIDFSLRNWNWQNRLSRSLEWIMN